MPRFVFAIFLFFFSATHAYADTAAAIKAFEQGEYETALAGFRQPAESGDAEAQYRLGLMYDGGRGVDVDAKTALDWFRKAADQGHDEAQRIVGIYYEEGKVVGKSYSNAVNWYAQSAKQGNAKAQHNLGGCIRMVWGSGET